MKKNMRMKRRFVKSVNRERRTEYQGVVMFELNLDFVENKQKHKADVLLLEEDYNMIKDKGYYLC